MPILPDSDEEVLEEEWVNPIAFSVVLDAEDSGSEVSNPPASSKGSDGKTSD
jgi:hypothetical protein